MGLDTRVEDAELRRLDAEIAASRHAALATDPKVKRSLEFHGMLRKLEDAAVEAGVSKDMWSFVYSLSSNHSHVSGFHIMKLWHMRDGDEAAFETRRAVTFACPALAGILAAYRSLVPEVQNLIEANEVTRRSFDIALSMLALTAKELRKV